MDARTWEPEEPEYVCFICHKPVTPKTAIVMIYSDEHAELTCFECMDKMFKQKLKEARRGHKS
jgi:hypothetical protein